MNDVEYISELWETNVEDARFKSLQDIRIKNLNRIVLFLAHLNINSLRNKLDLLVDQIKENVDVLAILETKLDDTFPVGQFKILGYTSPFRLDRNQYGGEILVFVRKDIPEKNFYLLKRNSLRLFSLSLNFHKKK